MKEGSHHSYLRERPSESPKAIKAKACEMREGGGGGRDEEDDDR